MQVDVIKTCAELCESSYDDAAPGFTTVGGLRYGVFGTPHGQIVCIRGTANFDNWLTDARVFPARSCGGYLAHKGFVAAYRELCAGGMPTSKGAPVIATGHSLGGALATLLAEHIECPLVTFGSPRVYWRFGRAPTLDHIRVVRDDDPVPMVPKFLYSHRTEPMKLKDNDLHLIQIGDHFMTGYRKMLATIPVIILLAGCSTVNCNFTGDNNRVMIEVPKTVTTSPVLTARENTVPLSP